MCTTTNQTKTANKAVDDPSTVKKPDPLPAVRSLQAFLTDAYTAEKANLEPTPPATINGFTLPSTTAAISIRVIDNDPNNNHYAGINDTKMFFSGSLVKVAALYVACDLRAAARIYAKANSGFTDTNSFLASFGPTIDTSPAIQRLQTFGQGLHPDLKKIFQGFKATAPNQVDFIQGATGYQHFMEDIGENPSATKVIDPLGYAYINVSLMKGGFFNPDPAALNGIWLAGDYSGEASVKSVRVPVENDVVPGGSGQAITTKEMSRMFYLVHTAQGYPHIGDPTERAAANKGIHDILATEGSFFQNTTSTLHISESPLFTKHCAKVGIAPLGPLSHPANVEAISEGDVEKWTDQSQITAFNTKFRRALTGDFALCWQNMYPPNSHFDALVRVINTTIKNFLTQ